MPEAALSRSPRVLPAVRVGEFTVALGRLCPAGNHERWLVPAQRAGLAGLVAATQERRRPAG